MPRTPYDLKPLKEPLITDDITPPIGDPIDAEVDVDVLRSVPKQFTIEDEKSANWLVKKVIAARQYAERVKVWAEQELRRAEREEQTLMFLFGRQIEGWVRSELERLNGKKKSLTLPAGAIGFRTIAQKLVVDDEPTVIEWAKVNLPTAVIVVEKLAKSVLNEHTEQSGEIPDTGVHIEPACERFYVK